MTSIFFIKNTMNHEFLYKYHLIRLKNGEVMDTKEFNMANI